MGLSCMDCGPGLELGGLYGNMDDAGSSKLTARHEDGSPMYDVNGKWIPPKAAGTSGVHEKATEVGKSPKDITDKNASTTMNISTTEGWLQVEVGAEEPTHWYLEQSPVGT